MITLDELGQKLHPAASKRADAFSLTSIDGNVVVVRFEGDVSAFRYAPDHPLDFAPRQALTAALYAQLGDVYDFIVLSTDFPYIETQALGFYAQIKNDVEGIGIPLVDHSQAFGSAGVLQGMIETGSVEKYLDGTSLDVAQFQGLILHEVAHRWSAWVQYRTDEGDSPNLMTAVPGHWNYLLDSDGSHMYGHDWQPLGNGTWRAGSVRERYSDLDLYLMGFLPAAEVAPITLLHAGNIPDHSALVPVPGAEVRAEAETLTIQQIIASEGARVPASTQSPRTFRVAYVYLYADQEPSAALLRELNGGLLGVGAAFQRQTRGLGYLDFRPAPYTAGTAEVDWAAAQSFLTQRKGADGLWADTAATTVRDSCAAVRALAALGVSVPDALTRLKNHGDRDIDDTARIVALLADFNQQDGDRVTRLLDAQQADGGFTSVEDGPSVVLDTALALDALSRAGGQGDAVRAAVAFLMAQEQVPGAWGSGDGTAFETALVLAALQGQTEVQSPDLELAVQRAHAGLLQVQGAHGALGQTDVDFSVTCLLQTVLARDGSFNSRARDFLQRAQAANGSFNGTAFDTALVVSTLKSLENLAIADISLRRDAVTLTPEAPVGGMPLQVKVQVRNQGNGPAEGVVVRLYLNHPDAGGTLQVEAPPIQTLGAGAQQSVDLMWDVPLGLTDFDLVLTALADGPDGWAADNTVSIPYHILLAGPDPLLAAERTAYSTLSPVIGEQVHVGFTVRNAGSQPAQGVTVTLFDGHPDAGGVPVAGPLAVPNLAPVSDYRADLAWTVTGPVGQRSMYLDLSAADDERLGNNRLRQVVQVLPFVSGVDIGIDGSTVLLTPDPQTAAPQNLTASVTVQDLGDIPAGLFTLTWYDGDPDLGGGMVAQATGDFSEGPTTRVTLTTQVPYLSDHTYGFRVSGAEPDARPDNNQAARPYAAAALEDFEVLPHSLTAEPLAAGNTVHLSAVVGNRNARPRAGVSVLFEVDSGTGFQPLSRKTVSLAGASEQSVSYDWPSPREPISGVFRVRVDSDALVAEIDETDNAATLAFETTPDPRPNLRPLALGFSAAPYFEGETLEVTVTVANIGGADAADASVGLYLNNPAQPLTTPAGLGALASGGETTITLTLPSIAFRGDQLILARVETAGEESFTDDNDIYKGIYVTGGPNPRFGPVPLSLSPAWPGEGESVSLVVDLINDGSVDAESVVVRLYADAVTGAVLDEAVIAIPQGGTTHVFHFTADARISALVCAIDPDNLIVEQVETDNVASMGLVLRNGELAADFTLFSPNGDGVMDAVTLFWDRPESVLEIDVVDMSGVRVAGWADLPSTGNLIWHGLDADGVVLPDGYYLIRLKDPISRFPLRDISVGIDTNRSRIEDGLASGDPGLYNIAEEDVRLRMGDSDNFLWADDSSSLMALGGFSGPPLYLAPDGSSLTYVDSFNVSAGFSAENAPGKWLLEEWDKSRLGTYLNGVLQTTYPHPGYDYDILAWTAPNRVWAANGSRLLFLNPETGDQETLTHPERDWYRLNGGFRFEDTLYLWESDTDGVHYIHALEPDGRYRAVVAVLGTGYYDLVAHQGRYAAFSFNNDLVFVDVARGETKRWSDLYPGQPYRYGAVFKDARLHEVPADAPLSRHSLVADWQTGRRFVVDDDTLAVIREAMSPRGNLVAVAGYQTSAERGLYTTRQNLGVAFEAFLTGEGAVQVQGSVADRNFRQWSLAYARLDAPDTWRNTGIQGDFQVLDSFLGIWVPEQPGAYLLRLEAFDLAGNSTSRVTLVEVYDTLPFFDLKRAPYFVSPNGDGLQDEVVLDFQVRQAFEAEVVIYDAAGYPVRTLTRFYGSPGPATLTWDGRDSAGAVVADGSYRLDFNGLPYSCVVDTTAPELALRFGETVRRAAESGSEPTLFTGYELKVFDPNIRRWSLERRREDGPWLEVAADGGNYETDPDDGLPDRLHTASQVADHDFRITATDAAGNTATLHVSPAVPPHIWTLLDARPEFNAQEPLADVAVGAMPLLTFHALLPRDHFPLTLSALEYTESGSWSDLEVIVDPAAEQTVFEGAHLAPVVYDRNLPITAQTRFRLVFTDALGNLWRTESLNRLKVRFHVSLEGVVREGDGRYAATYRVTTDVSGDDTLGRVLGLPSRLFPQPQSFGRTGWESSDSCPGAKDATFQVEWHNDDPPAARTLSDRFLLDDIRLNAGSPNEVRLGRALSTPFCGSGRLILEAVPICREDRTRTFRLQYPAILEDGTIQFFKDDAGALPLSPAYRMDSPLNREIMVAPDYEFGGPGLHPLYVRVRNAPGKDVNLLVSGENDAFSASLEGERDTPNHTLLGYVLETDALGLLDFQDQTLCAPSPLERDAASQGAVIPRVLRLGGFFYDTYQPFEKSSFSLERPGLPFHRLWAQPLDMDEPVVDFDPRHGQTEIDAALLLGHRTWVFHLEAFNASGYCFETTAEVSFSEEVTGNSGLFGIARTDAGARYYFSPNQDQAAETARVVIDAHQTSQFAAWVETTTGDTVAVIEAGAPLPPGKHVFTWNGTNGREGRVADGTYRLVVAAYGACMAEHKESVLLHLDTQSPVGSIDSPNAGPVLLPAPLTLSAEDDTRLALLRMTVVPADAGAPTQILYEAVDPPPLRAQPLPALVLTPGTYTLQLTLRDRAENTTLINREIEVSHYETLAGFDVTDPWISPNADGVLDGTLIRYQLTTAADVRLILTNGTLSTTLETYTARPAGTYERYFDGRIDQTAAPDGPWQVSLEVEANSGLEVATLPLYIDTLPPHIHLFEPQPNAVSDEENRAVSGEITDGVHGRVVDVHLEHAAPGRQRYTVSRKPGSRDGRFFEQIDQGEPGENSLFLTAVDMAGNRTEQRVTYIHDPYGPILNTVQPEANQVLGPGDLLVVSGDFDETYPDTLEISLRPIDEATPAVALKTYDAAELAAGSFHFETLLEGYAEGDYRLTLVLTDRAGHVARQVRTIGIDTTLPDVALASLPRGGLVTGPVSLEGRVTDHTLVYWRLEILSLDAPGTYVPIYEGTQAVASGVLFHWTTLPPDGAYRMRLTARDAVGGEQEVTMDLIIDQHPPSAPEALTVYGVPSGSGTSRTSRVTANWSAVDDPSLLGYRLYRDGQPLFGDPIQARTFEDYPVEDGNRIYDVVAVDTAGNESDPRRTTLILDTRAPAPLIAYPADGAVIGGIVTVTGSVVDERLSSWELSAAPASALSQATLLAMGRTEVPFGNLADWTVGGLPEGPYVLRLRASDSFGNVGEMTVGVTVENQAPSKPAAPNVARDASGYRVDWAPAPEADVVMYRVYRNDTFLATTPAASAYLDQNLPDGFYSYRIMAVDAAGNRSPLSDPSPLTHLNRHTPSVQWINPVSGSRFEEVLALEVFSEDRDLASVTFQYRQGSGAWETILIDGTAPWSTPWAPALPDGNFDLRAVAAERETGAVDAAPPIVSVVKGDATPPEAPALDTALVTGHRVQLTWTASTASDLAGYRLFRDGQAVLDIPAPAVEAQDTDVPLGAHEYRLAVLDLAGNSSALSTPRSVEVVQAQLAGDRGVFPTGAVTLTGSGHPAYTTVEVLQDGQVTATAPIDLGMFTLAFTAEVGTYDLAVRLLHPEGHTSVPAAFQAWVPAAPLPPTDVSALEEAGGNVRLDWRAPTPGPAGYLLTHNETSLQGSYSPTVSQIQASSSQTRTGYLTDGNVGSVWYTTSSDTNRTLDVRFTEPTRILGLSLQWYTYYGRPTAMTIEAEIDGALWPIWSFDLSYADTLDTLAEGLTSGFVVTDHLKITLHAPGRVGIRELAFQAGALLHEPLFVHPNPGLGLHRYQVSSVGALGQSVAAPTVVLGIGDVTPPEPPTGVTAVAEGDTVHLSWVPSVSTDVVTYRVYRNGLRLTDTPGAAHEDLHVFAGTYTYGITAIDGAGNESVPESVSVTVEAGIAAPVLSVDIQADTQAVRLSWTYAAAESHPATFRVYYGNDTTWFPATHARPFTADHLLLGERLPGGTLARFRVAAVDALGQEHFSNTVTGLIPLLAPALFLPMQGGGTGVFQSRALPLSGVAEPGGRVHVYRNNLIRQTLEAASEARQTLGPILGLEPIDFDLSTDGRILVASQASPGRVVVTDLETEARTSVWTDAQGHGVRLSPDARQAAFVDRGELSATGMLKILDTATGTTTSPFPAGAVSEPLWWHHDGRLLFASQARVYAYNPHTRALETLYETSGHLQLIALDRGIDRLVAVRSEGGVQHLESLSLQGETIPWFSTPMVMTYTWGHRTLVGLSETGDLYRLNLRADHRPLAGAPAYVGTHAGADGLVGLTPWAREVLLKTHEGALVAHRLDAGSDGATEQRAAQAFSPVQTENGRLIYAVDASGFQILITEPAGYFETDLGTLDIGAHYITLQAEHPATGVTGPRSADMLLHRGLGFLPDLQTGPGDLRVLPQIVTRNRPAQAWVTLRNLGGTEAQAATVSWTMVHPDGSLSRPRADDLIPSLAPNGVASSGCLVETADLEDGTYRLVVDVDASDAIEEGREDNNQTAWTFTLYSDPAPLLTVTLEANPLEPLATLHFAVDAFNAGTALADARLETRILTDTGIEAQTGPVIALGPLPGGETVYQQVAVPGNTLLAGAYHLVVDLYDGALLTATVTTPFSILPDARLEIVPGFIPATVQAGTELSVTATLRNSSANVAFADLSWAVVLRHADGTVVQTLQNTAAPLPPGAAHSPVVFLPTADLTEGAYVLSWEVFEAGVSLASAEVGFTCENVPVYRVGASVYATPANLIAGTDIQASGVVRNLGNRTVHLAARLQWEQEDGTVLRAYDQAFDPAPEEEGTLALVLGTTGLSSGTYRIRFHNHHQLDAPARFESVRTVVVTTNRVPEITVTGLPAGGHAAGPITPVITVVDDDHPLPSAEALVNGAPFTSGETLTDEGAYTLEVQVRDAAGNSAAWRGTFDIDGSAPEIDVLNIVEGAVVDAGTVPAIQVRDLNIVTTDITLNGDTYTRGTPINLPGSQALVIHAEDVLGHGADLVRTFTVASAPNLLALSGVVDGQTYGSPVSVQPALYGGASLAYFRINGAHAATPITLQHEGAFLIEAGAVLGSRTQEVSALVFMDFTPPVVTVQGVVDLGAYRTPVRPTVLVDGVTATQGVTLDGLPFVSGSEVATEGTHVLQVIARDTAGNQTAVALQFTYDADPPELTVIGVADGASYQSPLTVSWQASDAAPVVVTAHLNDVVVTSPLTVSASGQYELRIIARDEAGNTTGRTLHFTVEDEAPLILITGIADGQVLQGPVTPTIEVPNGTFTATLNDHPFASGTTVSDEGAYALVVEAVSTAGVSLQRTVAFILDRTAPELVVAGIQDGAAYTEAVTPVVSQVEAHPGTLMLTVDQQPYTAGTVLDQPGHHLLRATAIDRAGNQTVLEVAFDLLAVAIDITGVADQSWYNQTVTPRIEYTGLAVVSGAATLNGAVYDGAPVTEEGTYTLQAVAEASNGATAEAALTFYVDKTAPEVMLTGVSDGATYAHPVAVEASVSDTGPYSLTLLLNDAPYIAGTDISDPGAYRVTAAAVDAAGNRTDREAAFTVVGSGAEPPELTTVADAFLRQQAPHHNTGGETFMQVSEEDRAVIAFDAPHVQAAYGAGPVARILLRVYVEETSGWAGDGLTAYPEATVFEEKGATWTCPVDSDPLDAFGGCAEAWSGGSLAGSGTAVPVAEGFSGWLDLDVTTDVAAALQNGAFIGWALKKGDEQTAGRLTLASREGLHPPRLIFAYTEPPVDTEPPILQVSLGPAPFFTRDPVITVTYTDTGSKVDTASLEVLIDSLVLEGSVGDDHAVYTVHDPDAGLHTVTARIRDTAGNVAQASAQFEQLVGTNLSALFPIEADTVLRLAQPNLNLGAETELALLGSFDRPILGWDSAAVLAQLGTVHHASLNLYLAAATQWGSEGDHVEIRRLTAPWTESGATWYCPDDAVPGNGTKDCGQSWAGGAVASDPTDAVYHENDLTGWTSYTVTSDLREFQLGTPAHGWMLRRRTLSPVGTAVYVSREGAEDRRPYLSVGFDAPEPDTTAPVVHLIAPQEAAVVYTRFPDLRLDVLETETGFDTLDVQVTSGTGTFTRTRVGDRLTCVPLSPLPPGPVTITFVVTDRAGNTSVPLDIHLDIQDPLTTPTPPMTGDDGYQTPWDAVLEVAAPGLLANDSDPNGDTLETHLLEGPARGTLSLRRDGGFTYVPEPGVEGPVQFTYKAWDGRFITTAVATIHVRVGNHLPVAADDVYTVTPGMRLQVDAPGVLANDADPEGQPLIAYLVTPPPVGQLGFHADGSFWFDPPADFSEEVAFTYKVDDGRYQTHATVTLQPAAAKTDTVPIPASATEGHRE